MKCSIYRCSKKDEMYLYVREKDDFSGLPDGLMGHLGQTEFVMDLTLSADRPLARENVTAVMKNLETRGFHLQMPAGANDNLAWWDNEKLKEPDSPSRLH